MPARAGKSTAESRFGMRITSFLSVKEAANAISIMFALYAWSAIGSKHYGCSNASRPATRLFPVKFVSLAVFEGQPEQIELARLIHLELHETTRLRPQTLGDCCIATVRHKLRREDIAIPGRQLKLEAVFEPENQRVGLKLDRGLAKTRIDKIAG